MSETDKKNPNQAPGRRGRLREEPGFEPDFKTKVVLDYLSGKRDQRSVALQYGVSQTSLCFWIKSYLSNKEKFMAKKPKKGSPLPPEQQELALLKKQLEDEKLKNIALQEMIKIAEKQFNIPIQKKPGAKQ